MQNASCPRVGGDGVWGLAADEECVIEAGDTFPAAVSQ